MAKKTVTALVTGCSEGGIGFGLVQELRKRGVHVFATARTVSKMASLEGQPDVTLLALDVTSAESIDAAVARVAAATDGRLDYLVNNAGAQTVRPFLDTSMEDIRTMFEVNVFGVAAVTKGFAPLLIKAKGMVVNLASISGYMCPPYMGMYAASKAACECFSETIRHELKPFDVKVLTVITGAVKTNIFTNAPNLDPLPADSLYMPAKKEYEDRVTGRDVQDRLGTIEEFAKGLVNDMLRGKTGRTKVGKLSAMIPFLTHYTPSSLVDSLAEMNTGLDKLGK